MTACQRNQFFTLLELLIVISVISILISMLLPALSNARKASKSIVCKSNLRQYGIGSRIFMKNHNGAIFKSFGSWYAGGEKGIAGVLNVDHKTMREGKTLSCPDRVNDTWVWSFWKLSYGFNIEPYNHSGAGPGKTKHIAYPNLTQVPNPSGYIMFSDSNHAYATKWSVNKDRGIRGRHMKANANYVCLDGHVSNNLPVKMSLIDSPETLWIVDGSGMKYKIKGTWSYIDKKTD